jgi:hypothetical protein
MKSHFFNHYYKFIVGGICTGICLAVFVVYASGDVAGVDEVLVSDVVGTTTPAETVVENASSEGLASTSEFAPVIENPVPESVSNSEASEASTPAPTSNIDVAPDNMIGVPAVVDVTTNTSTTSPATSSQQTSPIAPTVNQGVPVTGETIDCFDDTWLNIFVHPLECIQMIDTGFIW